MSWVLEFISLFLTLTWLYLKPYEAGFKAKLLKQVVFLWIFLNIGQSLERTTKTGDISQQIQEMWWRLARKHLINHELDLLGLSRWCHPKFHWSIHYGATSSQSQRASPITSWYWWVLNHEGSYGFLSWIMIVQKITRYGRCFCLFPIQPQLTKHVNHLSRLFKTPWWRSIFLKQSIDLSIHVGLIFLFVYPNALCREYIDSKLFKPLCCQNFNHARIHTTLPETNIAPDNQWLEDVFPFGLAYFQGGQKLCLYF